MARRIGGRPVEHIVILPSPLAVDRNARSYSGFGRRGARLGVGQLKHTAAVGGRKHRQPRDVAHDLAELGVLGVDLAGSTLDSDRELGFAEFELDVEPQVVGQTETLRGDSRRLKTGRLDFDEILPWQEMRYAVEAAVVGRCGINRSGSRADRAYSSANDGSVTRIGHPPDNRASDALRRRGWRCHA